MDKAEIRKNRLDLEYHGESQKANALLILLTTGILAFLGTFLWLKDERRYFLGIGLTFLISIIALLIYRKVRKRMKEILEKIENL